MIFIISFLNLVFLAISFLFAGYTLQEFGRRFLSSLLQNGFSEEFLFSGALMTRLIRLSNPGWHFSANLPMFDGSIIAALTFSVISQGLGGGVFAVAMQRGGNLIAPSTVYILSHFNPF